MAFITIAGENQIAKKQGDNATLNINQFVLAYIDGLGGEPATRIESVPAAEFVVDQLAVTKSGYVNTNQVVYSLVMGSDIGDYDFNWIGLVDDEGVLIAVSYVPTIQKRKNNGAVAGNTLTRNFLLAYTGIQQIASINVPAETWQIDFSARLLGIDERERLSNLDIYGHESFLNTGWEVTGADGTYNVAAGVGYVGGIRIDNGAAQEITVAALPTEIWLNVSQQGNISDVSAVVDFVLDTGPFADYTDASGITHYMTKVAELDASGNVVDTRVASYMERAELQAQEEAQAALSAAKTYTDSSSAAVLTSAIAMHPTLFEKRISQQPAFQMDAGTLKNAADLIVNVGGEMYTYSEAAGLLLPPSASVGTDFAIYATPDGLVVSPNFTVPDGYTALTSRRVGGFHYQDGFINEYSLYDLKYRPNVRDPRGMARSPQGIWADIYLLNTTPDLLGTSAHGAQIADGGSAPKVPAVWGGDGSAQYDDFSRYTAARVLAAFGKRLPFGHEFEQLAFGSTTGYNRGTDPVITEFNAAARSMIGCEGVSGVQWQWGAEMWDRGNGATGYSWYAGDTNGEGQIYSGAGSEGVGASLFGGYWDYPESGPRCSLWRDEPWYANSGIAARGVCDHFESC